MQLADGAGRMNTRHVVPFGARYHDDGAGEPVAVEQEVMSGRGGGSKGHTQHKKDLANTQIKEKEIKRARKDAPSSCALHQRHHAFTRTTDSKLQRNSEEATHHEPQTNTTGTLKMQ
jgi:hypothetical protein